jgi:pyridoxine 5-phosphate synthase
MTALSVNLNKIALLRNSREGEYPSVIDFANIAIEAGADGITVHPRPDQRHIRVEDVYALAELTDKLDKIEFNIEGNPFAEKNSSGTTPYPGLMSLIETCKPNQATLVPDNNTQLTSDHGFDLLKDGERLKPILDQLTSWGVRSSLFMDPDLKQIEVAKNIGADRIELYTGPYAISFKSSVKEQEKSLNHYRKACEFAIEIGLDVNAGHDLNLKNLPEFLTIGNIAEVSIGHALTVDALLRGYKTTILDYSRLCHSIRNN